MPISSYDAPILAIMVIVPKEQLNYSFVISILFLHYNALTAVHPWWVLKMEPAIKRNAKPFTALGPGLRARENFPF